MTMFVIGKKVPKGFTEVSGSIHLGNGIWMFSVVYEKDVRK
jgi:hypothetical protein